jgi:hypothetical protein
MLPLRLLPMVPLAHSHLRFAEPAEGCGQCCQLLLPLPLAAVPAAANTLLCIVCSLICSWLRLQSDGGSAARRLAAAAWLLLPPPLLLLLLLHPLVHPLQPLMVGGVEAH